MELTYIYHSCFVLETASSILIFDYWRDPSEAIKWFVAPGIRKHIYVLASHFHEDHFSSEIFGWRKNNPEGGLTYILSKDILKHRRAPKEQADVWLAKGGVWHDDNIGVTATGSNDSGVSWVIDIEGKRIFHAGDLCNWYARFLENKATQISAFSEEMGMMVNPLAEEKRFLGELKDIGKITDHFDLAMFPIDGRIGNGYTRGARQFISRFRVGMLVPMHFVASGFESARRMAPYCQERGVDFWQISKEGESITL